MHCRVRYLLNFDLKIRSGQVCMLVTSAVVTGGAAPVQQIKSQVKSFSVLTSLVECQMSMYQELIIEMDIKNS